MSALRQAAAPAGTGTAYPADGVPGPRTDPGLRERLAASAARRDAGVQLRTEEFSAWLAERGQAHRFVVARIPFAALDGWDFAPETGNLHHRSGRFFTVEGLSVRTTAGAVASWQQPIIRQHEVGVLGILMKEFDGVPHFLMQAKMEPGNPNLLQLSPTVQATRSNYTRVHGGAAVRYLEYFMGPRRGRTVCDVLQSEHGSWFYRKNNRNVIVETTEDVPAHEDFCWLTLGQLYELLGRDNTVNMDSRTVLSALPLPDGAGGAPDGGGEALLTDAEMQGWLTSHRSEHAWHIERVPLLGLPDWYRTDDEVARHDGRFFRLVAVSVRAGSREVARWSQPLLEPVGMGVTAFVVRDIGGVRHVLVQAKAEGGLPGVVELGPTVQCVPDNHPADRWPFLLDHVLSAGPARVLYSAVHAEEGGRFRNAESRYLVVEADDRVPARPPAEYAWLTVPQLSDMVRQGRQVNVQARTLLACLASLA